LEDGFQVVGYTPQYVCNVGNWVPGEEFFLIIQNALSRIEKEEIVEIHGNRPEVKEDLKSWCKLNSHTLLETIDAGEYTKFLVKKGPFRSNYTGSPDWGIQLQRTEKGAIRLKDWLTGRMADINGQPHAFLGFVPRGAVAEAGNPEFSFALHNAEEVWTDNAADLYEQAKSSQWNASTDIPWDELPELPEDLEWAVCQIMTFLAENEFSAFYVPAKFLHRIHPHFIEPILFLATLVQDEARHIEAFTKRAMANGGGLQYSSVMTERSLHSLFIEEDYFKSSFMMHVLGEGTFLDLLQFIENYAPDDVTRKIVQLARQDEARHVAYGISHVRQQLQNQPGLIQSLFETVEQRQHFVSAASGGNSHTMEALAILAGGGRNPDLLQKGFKKVKELQEKMHSNRIKRLVHIGLTEEQAISMSKLHTPNFM
jgi:TusA-related sulfurtransferase